MSRGNSPQLNNLTLLHRRLKKVTEFNKISYLNAIVKNNFICVFLEMILIQ